MPLDAKTVTFTVAKNGPDRAFQQIQLGFPLVYHFLQISEVTGRFKLVLYDITKAGMAGIETDIMTEREFRHSTIAEAVLWWGSGTYPIYAGLVFPEPNFGRQKFVESGIEYHWRLFIYNGVVHMILTDPSGAVVGGLDSSPQLMDALYFYEMGTEEWPEPLFVPLEYWYSLVDLFGNFTIQFTLDLDTISGNWGGNIGTWTAAQALRLPSTTNINDSHYPKPKGMHMLTYQQGTSYHVEAGINDNT